MARRGATRLDTRTGQPSLERRGGLQAVPAAGAPMLPPGASERLAARGRRQPDDGSAGDAPSGGAPLLGRALPGRRAAAAAHRRRPPARPAGRVRTKTVKKASRVIIEKYYQRLTLDFDTNKRICEEVAIIQSKRLRNKIAGFTTVRRPAASRSCRAAGAVMPSPRCSSLCRCCCLRHQAVWLRCLQASRRLPQALAPRLECTLHATARPARSRARRPALPPAPPPLQHLMKRIQRGPVRGISLKLQVRRWSGAAALARIGAACSRGGCGGGCGCSGCAAAAACTAQRHGQTVGPQQQRQWQQAEAAAAGAWTAAGRRWSGLIRGSSGSWQPAAAAPELGSAGLQPAREEAAWSSSSGCQQACQEGWLAGARGGAGQLAAGYTAARPPRSAAPLFHTLPAAGAAARWLAPS